jgi:DNA-binding GntR family transcriptional regulator
MTESLDRAKAREVTDDPTPWVQLRHSLIMRIQEGILEPGDEVGLYLEAADFGVGWPTALKAFRALVDDGKLLPPQGSGRPYTVANKQLGTYDRPSAG